MAEVAKEKRHPRAHDRPRVLDDAVEILGLHVVPVDSPGAE
jgi:hypothetical protein